MFTNHTTMKTPLPLITLFALLLISGCDKIDDPYLNTSATPVEETEETIRKILIEDFTGHTCGNCPAAAVTAQQLHDLYGDKIIVASVHAGWFAIPYSTGEKYLTDFRTTAGEAYNTSLGITSNPIGCVNRITRNNSQLLPHGSWGTAVEEIKDLAPDVKLAVSTSYTSATRKLTVEVIATGLNELAGTYSLVLYFVEDNVVDWQKDYTKSPENIADYAHRHVLRDNINGTLGDALFPDGISVDAEVTKSYNYTINNDWNSANSSVIAYVYEVNSKEIIQVEDASVE